LFDYDDMYITTAEGDRELASSATAESVPRRRRRVGRHAARWLQRVQGHLQHIARPVGTLATTTESTTEATLHTKAQLAGAVDINFKSDFFLLERTANSFEVAEIVDAAPGMLRRLRMALPVAEGHARTPRRAGGVGTSRWPSRPFAAIAPNGAGGASCSSGGSGRPPRHSFGYLHVSGRTASFNATVPATVLAPLSGEPSPLWRS